MTTLADLVTLPERGVPDQVVVGTICLLSAPGSSSPTALGLVVRVGDMPKVASLMLTSLGRSPVTGEDALLSPEATQLPFDTVVHAGIWLSVYYDQIGKAVGSIDASSMEHISRLSTGEATLENDPGPDARVRYEELIDLVREMSSAVLDALLDEADEVSEMRAPATDGLPDRLDIHAHRPTVEPALSLTIRDVGRAVRRIIGAREVLQAAVSWAGVEVGRTADRISWRNTGKPPIEVVVVREGADLWARGFVKKSRRSRPVWVECRLRPEAVAVLAPNGRTDPDAGRLSARSTVDRDGYFHMKLASVQTEPFVGELVDQLGVVVG